MFRQSTFMNSLKQRSALRTVILTIAIVLAVVVAWLIYRAVTKDATAQFLARHWMQPLAPQGNPPSGFEAIEASLSPEACGTCHAAQYADWSTALHSRTMGPGILWQFHILSQDESNSCLRCHAPLAEQKALAALQYKWTNLPEGPIPPYVSSNLHLQGLICAACHVRRHQRFGPPPKAQTAAHGARLPHDGFVAEKAFEDSRFCSTCHQFPPQGRSLAGKLIENTYEEWRTSPAAGQGLTCQKCHMPGKRHIWRGIHDKTMVTSGIRRELEVRRIDNSHLLVQATISTPGVGHCFPTYVVPKVTVTLWLKNLAGTREIARYVIGRAVSVEMDRELSDTRIPPGGKAVVRVEVSVPPGANHIEMHMEIEPAEHYARMYQTMLERNPEMDAITKSLLREALRDAQSTAYTLVDMDVAAPTRLNALQHAVAN